MNRYFLRRTLTIDFKKNVTMYSENKIINIINQKNLMHNRQSKKYNDGKSNDGENDNDKKSEVEKRTKNYEYDIIKEESGNYILKKWMNQ